MSGVFVFENGGTIDGADIGTTKPKAGNFTTVMAHEVICTSDARFKRNICTVQRPLQTLRQLRGVTWDWDESVSYATPVSAGVVAQELKESVPYAVVERADGSLGVNQNALHGVFIEAMKKLADDHDETKKTLVTMRTELHRLRKAQMLPPSFASKSPRRSSGKKRRLSRKPKGRRRRS